MPVYNFQLGVSLTLIITATIEAADMKFVSREIMNVSTNCLKWDVKQYFSDWCWNPYMIHHFKQYWLSCVCVTNARNVKLQLIQFVYSSLECGSWFSFLSWIMSELKFCFIVWKTTKQTNKILETVCRTEAVSHMWVFVFLKRGHDNCEGDPRSGQPSTALNLEVVTIVCELLACLCSLWYEHKQVEQSVLM